MSQISIIETLGTVVVGAFIGFLGSIGLESWKQRKEIAELKSRIREELISIKNQIHMCTETKDFQARAFYTDNYLVQRQDIIRKLPLALSASIRDSYSKINEIAFPASGLDIQGKKYIDALASINQTLTLL